MKKKKKGVDGSPVNNYFELWKLLLIRHWQALYMNLLTQLLNKLA